MPCRPQLIFRDIFAEAVEIPVIVQICIFNDFRRKGILRVDLLLDPVRQEYITVIAGIPVDDIPDLFRIRLFLFLKAVVYLYKKFIQDRKVILLPVLPSHLFQ